MRNSVLMAAVAGAVMAAASAQAAPTPTSYINLNGSSSNPNAGHNSGSYAYNPVSLALNAGTYTVSLYGGGPYQAYSVAQSGSTPVEFTDAYWQVSLDNSTSAYNAPSTGVYSTAAAAYSAYSALNSAYTFSLAAAQNVYFYIDDTAYPYFGDDTGGLSLQISPVPEPAALALLGAGVLGLVAFRRRGRAARAA